ncbi:unnamed protein product [Adineta steineri]|uniref:RING-type domain-containing protein n=1 Tax=Adineta steineri TaxID=433720 RepID=A0A814IIF0_9BILA|nr:unnamed protein product [Adineta steineri]CAF1045254.1 unnamed protein product [Adineta steineri]
MATNIGYKYENEDSIDSNLKCAICNEPFIDHVVTECQHLFCSQCSNLWMKPDQLTCPICRKTIFRHGLKPITMISFISILNQVFGKCILCNQSHIQRGNFQDHIDKICPNKITIGTASTDDCLWMGFREELQAHLNTCRSSRRQIKERTIKNQENDIETISTCQPIFKQGTFTDNITFTFVNPALRHVSDQEITMAVYELIINDQCTNLNLFGHYISPENFSIIASALSNNTSLKILELGQCNVNDSAVQFLASNISTHNYLECLELYDNWITDIGVEYLVNMLQLNQLLSQLKLAYNKISNQGVSMLIKVIVNHNSKLKYLNLEGNKLIDNSCIYSIFYLIKNNRALLKLNMENCNLSWYIKVLIIFYRKIFSLTNLEILL